MGDGEIVLIYGLRDSRNFFLKESPDLASTLKKPYFIDNYNIELINSLSGENWGNVHLDNKRKLIETVKKMPINQWLGMFDSMNQTWDLWKDYLNTLENHPKFHIKNIANNLYMKHTDQILKYFQPNLSEELANTIVKKGCKLGLELARERNDLKIWFVLDAIDFKSIVFKSGDFKESITGSELRYIYRNREDLEGQVVFYKDKKIVPAPWHENPSLWKKYDVNRKLNKKLLKTIEKKNQSKVQRKELDEYLVR
ncbi:hypothetical protein ACFFIF_10645 [Vagococcus entomophilus]|uniref:Uncharacterized protein n=1 Tax=Vagococcus entomophilus TaxID=1160095 RepID=A0A430AEW7_9ENTE|nr:hypothetical protein [Vagococcus entomophilus]RSU06152.1 hypothetical protein CBF30_10555 [Vagococcus entomophilus]